MQTLLIKLPKNKNVNNKNNDNVFPNNNSSKFSVRQHFPISNVMLIKCVLILIQTISRQLQMFIPRSRSRRSITEAMKKKTRLLVAICTNTVSSTFFPPLHIVSHPIFFGWLSPWAFLFASFIDYTSISRTELFLIHSNVRAQTKNKIILSRVEYWIAFFGFDIHMPKYICETFATLIPTTNDIHPQQIICVIRRIARTITRYWLYVCTSDSIHTHSVIERT